MKFISASFLLLIFLDSINASAIKYVQELQACQSAHAEYPDTFAGYRSGVNGDVNTARYDKCIQLTEEDEGISEAAFCQSATCRLYSDDRCGVPVLATAMTGVNVPVGGIDFSNMAYFANMLAQSAKCTKNVL